MIYIIGQCSTTRPVAQICPSPAAPAKSYHQIISPGTWNRGDHLCKLYVREPLHPQHSLITYKVQETRKKNWFISEAGGAYYSGCFTFLSCFYMDQSCLHIPNKLRNNIRWDDMINSRHVFYILLQKSWRLFWSLGHHGQFQCTIVESFF